MMPNLPNIPMKYLVIGGLVVAIVGFFIGAEELYAAILAPLYKLLGLDAGATQKEANKAAVLGDEHEQVAEAGRQQIEERNELLDDLQDEAHDIAKRPIDMDEDLQALFDEDKTQRKL